MIYRFQVNATLNFDVAAGSEPAAYRRALGAARWLERSSEPLQYHLTDGDQIIMDEFDPEAPEHPDKIENVALWVDSRIVAELVDYPHPKAKA